jgi:HKD family nuclease
MSFLGQTKPPIGYRLTYCVGTTFSLDLECLLQLALNSRRIEGPLQELNELSAFAALQDFQTKAVVLCQNCRIKESRFLLEETRGSKGIRRLLAALDSSVVAVPAPALKAAFHPKVWLFRYDCESGKASPVFTLFVQSRNLTASKDWDISTSFSGSISKEKNVKNKPIISFFEHLRIQAERSKKQKIIQRAIHDLSQVNFEAIPGFSDRWEFLFQWPEHQNWAPVKPSRYREFIAVSPFLGKTVSTLQGLSTIPKFTLVTGPKDIATAKRVKELAQRTYVMAGTNESAWDSTDPRPDQLGLHSKIYLGLKKGSDEVDIFIGSANLTDAAFRGKNCEAMIHLKSHKRHFRSFESEFIYENTKKEILHPWLRNLDALINSQGESDSEEDYSEKLLEDLRSRISQGCFKLRFLKRNQQAVLGFTTGGPIHLPKGVNAEFRLAGSTAISPLGPVLIGAQQLFHVPADERTEFLIIRLTHGERELRFLTVASSDLNRSARSRKTQNHLIKDADTFFEYLGLILGAHVPPSYVGGAPPNGPGRPKRKSRKQSHRSDLRNTAFLEPLLLHGLMEPEREKEIQEAIQTFLKSRHSVADKRTIAQFAELWARYRNASEALRRNG